MSFALQTSSEHVELSLAGRVGVQDAGPLWESLRQVLLDDATIRLNAADLEEMDTSIVQIVCRLGAIPGKLHIAASSEGFFLSLRRRGVANRFIDSPLSPSRSDPQPERGESTTAPLSEKERLHG
jgi:hypothetical protein